MQNTLKQVIFGVFVEIPLEKHAFLGKFIAISGISLFALPPNAFYSDDTIKITLKISLPKC